MALTSPSAVHHESHKYSHPQGDLDIDETIFLNFACNLPIDTEQVRHWGHDGPDTQARQMVT